MNKALGMIEFKTVSSGITAADRMVKTADVELLEAQTVCPGKYIALIAGDLSAVHAAVETAKNLDKGELIDSFVLGNPDDSIFPAIYGSSNIENVDALGILETYDAASIIVAADVAAKTALVQLIELRVAKGMCGLKIKTRDWVTVEGTLAEEQSRLYRGKGPVLNVSRVEYAEKPIQEVATFY